MGFRPKSALMSDPQTWVEALNVSPEDLSQWSAQTPDGTPLLVWCLEQGHVSIEAYLEWAREVYGLPVLDSQFFADAFDSSTLSLLRSDWSPWCFPVAKWEDVLIIACVEPPSEVQENQAYILADPTALHEAWGRSDARIPLPNMPPPLPKTGSTKAPALEDLQEDIQMDTPLDAPAGIDLGVKTKKFTLQLAGLEDDPVPDAPTQPPVPESLNLPEEEETILEEDEDTSLVLELKTAPPPLTAEMEPLPPLPPAPAAGVTATATRITVPAIEKNPPPADQVSAELQSAFERIREDYIGSVFLKCVDNQGFILKWDPKLLISKDVQSTPIALDTPSLFRIVFKTRLPYHGFAVDSPAHREVFAQMGLKTHPSCVSAIPLFDHNALCGMLVAFGEESAQTPKALERLQKVADDLASTIGPHWLKAG